MTKMIEELFDNITDIHIRAVESADNELTIAEDGVLLFPGPKYLLGEDKEELCKILAGKVLPINRHEFTVDLNGKVFRGQRSDRAIDGIWFRLRKMSDEAPTLFTLPSRLPDPIEKILMHRSLLPGGLILVSGAPGSGKTTTASAILVSRLMEYGGFAYTIEDPPEIIALNGPHGQGYCTQTFVYEGENGWEESIKEVLRSQPVGTNLILFLGEIRTPEAARMAIRAASNGFLVITTTFATDLLASIDTFYQLLGDEFLSSFSSVLRIVLYLRMKSFGNKRQIDAQILTSDGSSSRVAVAIRNRHFGQLKDELSYQLNLLAKQSRMQSMNGGNGYDFEK